MTQNVPRILELLPGGVEHREPWPSETVFFRDHLEVTGMAADDDRVVLNPFANLTDIQRGAVLINEAARVVMRRRPDLQPTFDLTEEQRIVFAGYGLIDDVRATIAARLLSSDPSAGTPTSAQVEFVQRLACEMGIVASRS